MQVVNKGAQDQLVTGSPSFTHFRSVYKRHTEFAMEHFRLDFRGVNLDLLPTGNRILRAKVDRNAQLVHDMYLHVTLPDIFSPVASVASGGILAPDSIGMGYDFQWIPNIGYNMINSVSLLINGTAIVTHTGEWMKLYSYVTHDANKKQVVDRMVGNQQELTDPSNAFSLRNQYPHSITGTNPAAPSILGRDLTIPLHFWFCENIGAALPLVALQYSEVEVVVEFASIYDLFTIRDTVSTSPTYGQRIRASPTTISLNLFLSPPLLGGNPSNPSLTNWSLNPYIEANYIFLGDAETIQLSKGDNSFLIKDNRSVSVDKVVGGGNDIELVLVNLCTRVIWVAQRSDIAANNGADNYTNLVLPSYPSYSDSISPHYVSGNLVGQNQSDQDILVDGTLIFDGAERFNTKSRDFFGLMENYAHHTGKALPGIYTYSFAKDHTNQPSGHVNGSMFNKTVLRLSTQTPPFSAGALTTQQCVVKSTVFNPRPVPVTNTASYNADQVVSVISKTPTNVYQYTYSVRAYVESYNFLRITRGIANVVFSS